MIGHLIYAAALNAPEIGDAVVKYIAKAMVTAIADEAQERLSGSLGSLGQSLASFGSDALCATVSKVDGVSSELEDKVGTILKTALQDFDMV